MADEDWLCVPRLRRGHPKMAALRRSELHSRLDSTTMLGDDDDVFDSVTWETPPAPSLDTPTSSGPGFRQSTVDSEEDRGPHDPKWEGYLIASVHDPVKELAETKDAYVSYLVSAKVRPRLIKLSVPASDDFTDQSSYILYAYAVISSALSRFCISKRKPGQGLPRMRRSRVTRQTPARFVLITVLRTAE